MSNVLLTLLIAATPAGSGAAVGEAQVIEEALAHNPTLRAAVLDLRRAEQDVVAEDTRYRPVLTLEAGITHSETPSLRSSDDGVTFPTSDSLVLGADLRHTFAFGTSVALSVDANRGLDERQFGAGSTELVQLGPSYGIVGRLTLTQPLLRGFGAEVGEAALRQARLLRTASEHARSRTASELLRDVLVAYWELWYAARALDIDRAAHQLAISQRDDARARLASGALAPVDVLTFETRVAELDQARVASETTLKQSSVKLATLLGRADVGSAAITPADGAVPEPRTRLAAEVVPAAVAESYELLVLRAQADVARDQARVAGEADRPRLDLDAYVQAQGLGNQEVPPALEQFFVGDAVSAHVGLVFEWPLSSSRREAQRGAAALSAERAAVQVEASEQQVRASAVSELLALDQARERVTLTTATASIAAQSAAAQEERYQTGGAILLEVYQAQDALRRARLGVERSRVDAVQAELRIDHLTGRLLARSSGNHSVR